MEVVVIMMTRKRRTAMMVMGEGQGKWKQEHGGGNWKR